MLVQSNSDGCRHTIFNEGIPKEVVLVFDFVGIVQNATKQETEIVNDSRPTGSCQ